MPISTQPPGSGGVALITGASRGLGLEFVRQLLEKGWVVLAGTRNTTVPDLIKLKKSYPERMTLVSLDVSQSASIAAAVARVAELYDGLDLLINNAGIFSEAGDRSETGFGEHTFEEGLKIFRTNALGTLIVSQAFASMLGRGRQPLLVGISSGYASISRNQGFPYHYAASKAAQAQYLKSLARDLSPLGVRIVILDPGWVSTDMGGPHATLTPERSVSSLLDILWNVTPEETGLFLNFSGKRVQT